MTGESETVSCLGSIGQLSDGIFHEKVTLCRSLQQLSESSIVCFITLHFIIMVADDHMSQPALNCDLLTGSTTCVTVTRRRDHAARPTPTSKRKDTKQKDGKSIWYLSGFGQSLLLIYLPTTSLFRLDPWKLDPVPNT